MRIPAEKSLKSFLLDFLCDLPGIHQLRERHLLVDLTNLGELKPKIDFGGSSIVFFEGLVTLLGREGKETLLQFLNTLQNTPFIGPDRRRPIIDFCHTLAGLPPNEWISEFPPSTVLDTQTFAPAILPRRLFIQYLNPEMLLLYGATKQFSVADLQRLALAITRYALFIPQESLVLPASYLFEVPFMRSFMRLIEPLVERQLIYFASPKADLEQYAVKKRVEYPDHARMFPRYASGLSKFSKSSMKKLLWLPRIRRSAFNDIAEAWKHELQLPDGLWLQLLRQVREEKGHLRHDIEDAIASVPDRLRGKAFIPRFAEELLPIRFGISGESQIEVMIGRAYLESYLEEFEAAILTETPLGDLDCGLAHTKAGRLQAISYRHIAGLLQSIGLSLGGQPKAAIQVHLKTGQ